MCQKHHHQGSSRSGSDNRSADQKRRGARMQDGQDHATDHSLWTRRSFLQTLGLGSLAGGLMLQSVPVSAMKNSRFLNRLSTSENNRVLILIQLSGGNDGLNTVIPVTNDIYYQKRPTIAIRRQDAIALSDDIGLHPSMVSLRGLWDDGAMSIVHNVGYHNHSRSHSRGTDVWVSGSSSSENLTTGWAGRFLVEDNPSFIENPPEFPLGVRIGGSASMFQTEFGNLGVTFGGAGQFGQFLEQGGFYDEANVPDTPYGRSLAYTRRVANASFKYLESIQGAAERAQNAATYPDSGLARSLAIVARLIRGGLPTKVFLVSRGGFDTHNNQGGTDGGHAASLADVADSVRAFYDDLGADGLNGRALTMTFSEFGRTLNENGSQGTDHGSSAPVMLFGPVNGGFFGEHANLTDLDRSGDPLYELDYRSVYSSILDNWFELGEQARSGVIEGDFTPLDIVSPPATSTYNTGTLPVAAELLQNYPNPFNPATVIAFRLPETMTIRLEVYDTAGRLIQLLTEGTRPAGYHEVRINASEMASGVYLYRLNTPGATLTRHMTLIR